MERQLLCPYLFAYGSLRNIPAAGQQHQLLQPAEHIGSGSFPGQLFVLNGYPGAVHAQGSEERVLGEVYRLLQPETTLPNVDDYEGCLPFDPARSEFRRELLTIQLENGSSLMAWVYLYNRSTDGLRKIESGDYNAFLTAR